MGKGEEICADDVIKEYLNNIEFYSKGGITVTGGEPLIQTEFVTELFKKAKKHNIHTCIDTSGITFRKDNPECVKKTDELIKYTDLVMLDIKHIDSKGHKELTGMDNDNVLDFAIYLDSRNIPIWIRHIIIEGTTDNNEDLLNLGKFIGKLKNLKALDVLPYHTMGVHKYKELGMDYPLEGTEPLPVEKAILAKNIILEGIRFSRK